MKIKIPHTSDKGLSGIELALPWKPPPSGFNIYQKVPGKEHEGKKTRNARSKENRQE